MRNHDVAARKCPKCHRVFSKVEHLRRHARSHTGERPFKCKACGRSYARSDVLNRHMRHHHPAAQEGDAVEAAAGWISMTDQPQERTSPPLHAGSHEGGTSNRRLSSGEQPPPECLTPQGLVIPETENQNWNPTTIDGMSGLDLQYDQGLHGFLHDVHAPGLTSDLHRSQSTAMPSSRRALNPFEPHMDSSLGLAPPHRTVDSGMDLGSTFLEGLLLTPPGSGENQFGSPQKNSISNEQFEQVRRLWPTRRRRPTLSPSPICWDDVLLHPEDNIFSSTSLKALGSLEPSASALSSTLSPWALTEACRDRLTQTMLRYVSPNGQTDDPRGGSPPCSGPWNSELPPIDMLDICLDLYFGKFQVHLPFVHPGTFKPCDTPSILLFPMCLIGMMLLDRSASRKLIDDYLLGAIRHCRAEITSQGIRHCPAPDLFTVLGSACLVLFIAASTAEIAFEEQRQALYEEALCLARERGLFGSCSYNSGLIQIVGDDAITWNAWARMQSAQRLKACLILADAYSAHMLGTPPALLPGHIQMPLLCHDELFNAHTPHKWKKVLGNEDPWRMTSFMTPDIQNAPSRLHGLGLQTDLAVIWLDILRSHHERERRVGLFPGSLASSHESPPSVGTDTIGDYHLGSRLSSVFDTYGAELKAVNSNSLILWHFLCLQLTTDMGLIEDAAGRSGPEAAKVAVEGLRLWAPSTGARRACLHAAQMFMLVSHHRQSDGVMLHSEMAIFNAALVLGFYVFTAPDFTSSGRPLYDLLEEVDWTQVGTLGIDAQWSSGNVITPVSAAGAFIRDGGPICFSGAEYCNPYGAARRSFMNVACQLEEVGKWNVEEYCRVLRIISDTLFTPEDQHAES